MNAGESESLVVEDYLNNLCILRHYVLHNILFQYYILSISLFSASPVNRLPATDWMESVPSYTNKTRHLSIPQHRRVLRCLCACVMHEVTSLGHVKLSWDCVALGHNGRLELSLSFARAQRLGV